MVLSSHQNWWTPASTSHNLTGDRPATTNPRTRPAETPQLGSTEH
ncbi:hypothetical protein [Streptacidiphilus albus]|nr:hypothetical protein [Streptacidiphilus albus]